MAQRGGAGANVLPSHVSHGRTSSNHRCGGKPHIQVQVGDWPAAPPLPLQGAQPMPSRCPPDAKHQPQWHL